MGQGMDGGLFLRETIFDGEVLTARLPNRLREVSGLALSTDGRLFAHADERAVIFELDPRSGQVLSTFAVGSRRGIKGDFEGLAMVGNRFFMITSRGQLIEFGEGSEGAPADFVQHRTGLEARCEVEGLAYLPPSKELLVACKTPARGDRDDLIIFAYRIESGEVREQLRVTSEALVAHGIDGGIHPSGVEYHAPTRSLILIAARERLILQLDLEGHILTVRDLPPGSHRQTEGIVILPDGTLVLADEGGNRRGTLTFYRPSPEAGS